MGVALVLFLLSPVTLLAWAAGQAWLRVTGMRWWKLALASLAAIAAVIAVEGGLEPALAQHFSGYVGWVRQLGGPVVHLPMPGAFLWPQLPPGHPDRPARRRLEPGRTAAGHRPGRGQANRARGRPPYG
jgi:hypothetical protein